MTCFSLKWCDLYWSPWVPTERATPAGSTPTSVPSEPGVYRIRTTDPQRMAYIGECEDLSTRVVGTWRRLNRSSPSDLAPQKTAARRLVQLREAHDFEFEISWYAAAFQGRRDRRLHDEQWRKGLEAYLLWRYRQEMRVSTIANHGRATLQPGEELGSNELRAGYPGRIRPSSTPLPEPENEPQSEIWMGRRWTFPVRYEDIMRDTGWNASKKELRESDEGVPVFYKAIAPSAEKLFKVGFTSRGSAGVRSAADKIPGRPRMAWSPLNRYVARENYVWRELRNDLIGGYFQQMGEPPVHQFSPPPEKPLGLRGHQLSLTQESESFYPS